MPLFSLFTCSTYSPGVRLVIVNVPSGRIVAPALIVNMARRPGGPSCTMMKPFATGFPSESTAVPLMMSVRAGSSAKFAVTSVPARTEYLLRVRDGRGPGVVGGRETAAILRSRGKRAGPALH